MMERAFILAVAMSLGVTGAAHAQSATSSHSDWEKSSDRVSCLEPYAPAVPKAEETTLKEMIEKVKPEIEAFIEESNKYLKCIGVKISKAQEEGDKEKIGELVKAHNDNVKYQKSVAGEFNETVQVLKVQIGLVPAQPAGTSARADGAAAPADTADAAKAAEGADAAEASDGAEETPGEASEAAGVKEAAEESAADSGEN